MVRRVVVAALEIIPTSFVVVDIAAVADGVAVDDGGSGRSAAGPGVCRYVPPRVVGVVAIDVFFFLARLLVSGEAEDLFHVALRVDAVIINIEILAAVAGIAEGKGLSAFIVDKVHNESAAVIGEGLPHQLSVEGVVGMGHAVHGLLRADAVGVVGIGRRLAAYRHRG